jgi:hypothetical protein
MKFLMAPAQPCCILFSGLDELFMSPVPVMKPDVTPTVTPQALNWMEVTGLVMIPLIILILILILILITYYLLNRKKRGNTLNRYRYTVRCFINMVPVPELYIGPVPVL